MCLSNVFIGRSPLHSLNCYRPAKVKERDAFLEELNEIITNLDRKNLTVCGDFNMVYKNNIDNIAGAPHSNREGGNFLNFLKVLKLEDSWRFSNNNAKEFTWSGNAPYAARRLDYILCAINVAQHLTNSEIIEYPCTDHKAVMTEMQMDKFPRGPPRWHFNSLHLKDKTFLDDMNAFIDECLETNEKEGVDELGTVKSFHSSGMYRVW